jgi:hypothetical protein
MKLELFTTCDAAADYNGKTCIMGTFDVVYSKTAPATHGYFSIVARIRFQQSEAGTHKAEVSLTDPDGKPLLPPAAKDLSVLSKDIPSGVLSFIVNAANVKFTKFGEHKVTLNVDGQPLGELPLYFVQKS